MKEKISVIIPSYNRGKIITDSINSILNQTYKNIEVIIVDDGSTDNTDEIIKKINDSRIKYIKLEENKGACYARNIGIKNSEGNYITFLDSDDKFRTKKIEKQLKNMIENDSDIDVCKVKFYSLDKKKSETYPSSKVMKKVKESNVMDELLNGNFITTTSLLIKKEKIINNKFDNNLPRLQDYDLVLRLAKNNKFSFTDEILVDGFRYGDNISFNSNKLLKATIIMSCKNYGLSKTNQMKLHKTFQDYIVDSIKNDYEKKIKECQTQNDELTKQLEIMNKKYEKVINSKGWKLLEKIRCLRRK